MERALVLEALKQSEEHVARGERFIAEQRALIEELKRRGRDTREAKELLAKFEECGRCT